MNIMIDQMHKNKMEHRYGKLFLKANNYDAWFENEESTDQEESVDLPDMPPLEGDEEEVKEEKGLKILIPIKLLSRLPILEPIHAN